MFTSLNKKQLKTAIINALNEICGVVCHTYEERCPHLQVIWGDNKFFYVVYHNHKHSNAYQMPANEHWINVSLNIDQVELSPELDEDGQCESA